MTSPTANSTVPNLASLLIIKRKMAAANKADPDAKQTPPEAAPVATGSHSNDKLTYRQDMPIINPTKTNPLVEETNEPPKVSRKTKQLEVELLDKRMEEINRKQEIQTNETLESWRGFDSLNYGFSPETSSPKPNLIPPVSKKQHTPPSSAREQPSPVKPSSPPPRPPTPKRINTPSKDRPVSKPASPKEKEPRESTPVQQKTIEKQPSPSPVPERKPVENQPSPPPPRQQSAEKKSSPPPRKEPAEEQPSPSPRQEPVEKQPSPPPRQEFVEEQPSSPPPQKPVEKQPTPPPRRSRIQSVSSLKQAASPDIAETKSEPSKSPVPIIENIYPISSIIANRQIFETNSPPFEHSPISTPNSRQFKLFPEIKRYRVKPNKNAYKSIQRSMDRYRFHLW